MASCSHYTLDYRLEACNTSGKNGLPASADMLRENLIKLENGAVIAFEEYGNANGEPVIFCHGWPSSRIMARLTDEPARDLGIRIISPDRPGISGSSLQPDRKLTDWPRLVARLTDHLAICTFRMLAISGARYMQRLRRCLSEWNARHSRRCSPITEVSDTMHCSRFTAGCSHCIEPDRDCCEDYFTWLAGSLITAPCPSSSTGFKNAIVRP
jgi:hypothetical protein